MQYQRQQGNGHGPACKPSTPMLRGVAVGVGDCRGPLEKKIPDTSVAFFFSGGTPGGVGGYEKYLRKKIFQAPKTEFF